MASSEPSSYLVSREAEEHHRDLDSSFKPPRMGSYQDAGIDSEGYRSYPDGDRLSKLQFQVPTIYDDADYDYDNYSDEKEEEEEGKKTYIRVPETFGLQDDSDPEEDSGEPLKRKFDRLMFRLSLRSRDREFKKTFNRQVKIRPEAIYVVCVDGYFRKGSSSSKRKKSLPQGGYGVIIRVEDGDSIVAKTGCAKVGISAFYHTVQGIRKSLDLLGKYPQIYRAYVMCNNDKATYAINDCFQANKDGKCGFHPAGPFDLFCEPCLQTWVEPSEFDDICEFVKGIVRLGYNYCRKDLIVSCDRGMNEAADFLAKMQLCRGEEEEFQPEEFPEELKYIVKEMSKHGELLTHPN